MLCFPQTSLLHVVKFVWVYMGAFGQLAVLSGLELSCKMKNEHMT